MKSLLTALALLSFVAASTVPYVAHAQTTTNETMPKKAKKKHVAKSHKAKKKVAKTKKKKTAPMAPTKG